MQQSKTVHETTELKDPWEMTYKEFLNEFATIMASVGRKEVKGKMDPTHDSYKPLTDEEQRILKKDWKSLSRMRGFTEEDIEEYDRWLLLCGRTTKLVGAIQYPWRNNMNVITMPPILYMQHVEWAKQHGKQLPESTEKDYLAIRHLTSVDFTPMCPIE